MRRLYKNEPPTSPLISSAKIPIPHRLLCKPGRYWTVDCNICFCTHGGIPSCATKVCSSATKKPQIWGY
ncbi:Pacifastin inhibitor (LCMII) [Popillia japonica]|uniref:Pacifastin inhibitor (LCMII) n=1 Tax=Popillia japonica TaxID=7064 RepID=A0AAW1IFT4_POPJA